MIKFIGRINRSQVNELYGAARAGLVVYQPAENHYEAQPIKMFEFMAAGLPVVASDFPLWREIVEENDCGICVDPTDAMAVRAACEFFLRNPSKGMEMGGCGRRMVEAKYNWDNEAIKLVKLYSEI